VQSFRSLRDPNSCPQKVRHHPYQGELPCLGGNKNMVKYEMGRLKQTLGLKEEGRREQKGMGKDEEWHIVSKLK